MDPRENCRIHHRDVRIVCALACSTMDARIRHQPLLFSLALLIWGAPMAATAAEQPLQQDPAQTTNVQPGDDAQAGTDALAKAAEPVTAKPPASNCRRSRALNLGVTNR